MGTVVKPFRSVRAPVVIAMCGVLALSSIASAASSDDGADDESVSGEPIEVAITAPSQEDPVGDGGIHREFEEIAKNEGITVSEAHEMMAIQARLSDFADEAIEHDDVLEFQFTPDGQRGVLAVEDRFEMSAELPSLETPKEVEVLTVALNPTERRLVESSILQSVDSTLQSTATADDAASSAAASYDPVANEFTVFFGAMVDDVDVKAMSETLTTEARERSGDATVRVSVPVEIEPVRGGKMITTGGSPTCTTGFGIRINNQYNGYITAGHCGGSNTAFNANGFNNVSNEGRRIGQYWDRMAIRASGASWLVQIHEDGTEVDMSATAGHIFLNGTYCHFGQTGFDQTCGTVIQVNVQYPHMLGTGDGITHPNTFVSQSERAPCFEGDSGGPVWQPRTSGGERTPRGLINAADGSGNCYYQSLDDNMRSNWSLL